MRNKTTIIIINLASVARANGIIIIIIIISGDGSYFFSLSRRTFTTLIDLPTELFIVVVGGSSLACHSRSTPYSQSAAAQLHATGRRLRALIL